MRFSSSASGRACLTDWDRPLTVNDILTLLLALKRNAANAGQSVVAIIVLRQAVPLPDNFLLTCIQGTLPALLDCCEQFVVVVEGDSVERARLRDAFHVTRSSARRSSPRLCDSLDAAFAYAQPFAPHDVLELQRPGLQQTPSPNRRTI